MASDEEEEEGVDMTRAEGMLDAFEHVGWGALLIDADGRVIGLNDEARRHVGCEITISHGRIAATHGTANAELEHRIAAIESAAAVPLGGVLLPRPHGPPVMAYVISVAGPAGGSQPEARAIVVLIEKRDPLRRGQYERPRTSRSATDHR